MVYTILDCTLTDTDKRWETFYFPATCVSSRDEEEEEEVVECVAALTIMSIWVHMMHAFVRVGIALR